MEAIVVGDLHGDINLYKRIRSTFSGEKIILVGDLIDSFVFTRTEQCALLEEVLSDIDNCEERRIQCVRGNHEWSYLWPERMKCSGYSSSFSAHIMPLFYKMYRDMPCYIFDDEKGVLITHAGLSQRLLQQYIQREGIVKEDNFTLLEIKNFLEKECRNLDSGIVYNIGHSRGGADALGGIFWCDWFVDFVPVEGITQIFGHTPVTGIKQKANNWMIDCLPKNYQVVRVKEDTTVEIINIS
jgi:hypothetical protein